jgi:hypothetical protein
VTQETNDIRYKTIINLQSIRIHLDALQWDFMQWLSRGEPAISPIYDIVCDEMRSWAMELMDAADGIEASLNT